MLLTSESVKIDSSQFKFTELLKEAKILSFSPFAFSKDCQEGESIKTK
jgi:hypothetical protein